MTEGLIRYHHSGHFHFVTFSSYHRQPFLSSASACKLFERALETIRTRYLMNVRI